MEKLVRFFGAFFGAFLYIVLLMGIYSIAEDITLTTYYPAPYGTYDELTTTGNTYLATTSGNVGIGTTGPNAQLDIYNASGSGTMRLSSGPTNYLEFTSSTRAINSSGSDLRLNSTSAWNVLMVGGGGKVGIGIAIPNYPLDVAGDINTTGDVRKNGTAYTNPDYVFEPGYHLMSVTELKNYVFENKHLPNLPSTDEIKKDGVKLFEQNRLLLEKLEEAYLHIFKLEERISKLESIAQRKR